MDSTNNNKGCFVISIDLKLAGKLREGLLNQGFQLTTPPHTLFAAQKQGVSCCLYTSGKLTVQGKGKEEFILYYLEPEILQATPFSHPEINIDITPRIGIDESGKGDFFGPLCIAGVFAGEQEIKKLLEMGVKDSKNLSDPQILRLSPSIRALCPHSIVKISPQRYNELYANFRNLNNLLGWGHATAIVELVEKTQCRQVLIDQFASEYVVQNALKRKQITVSLSQRHRAEEDPVVAAASILARAAFVQGIEQLSQEVGIPLPKGASEKVKSAARSLVHKIGKESLGNFAKLHFKTTQELFLP